MIHQSGAGPQPIKNKELNVANLTDAIKFVLKPGAANAAKRLQRQIESEVGNVISPTNDVRLVS
jgi:sterol 3beta-glucosyltransferase